MPRRAGGAYAQEGAAVPYHSLELKGVHVTIPYGISQMGQGLVVTIAQFVPRLDNRAATEISHHVRGVPTQHPTALGAP